MAKIRSIPFFNSFSGKFLNPKLSKENFLFFILLILFLPITSLPADRDYIFRHIKIEDGLSQSSISCLLQDQRGLIWIGTSNGLNRYDGYEITVFTHQPGDSTSLSDNGITSIYEDKQGIIWIGTTAGTLNRFDRKTEIFKHIDLVSSETQNLSTQVEYYEYPISFSRNNNNTITAITGDSSGHLWIGTWGKGIYHYNHAEKTIRHFFHDSDNSNSLSNNRIMKIISDPDKNIWIGTFGGGLNLLPSAAVTGMDTNEQIDKTKFIRFQLDINNPNSISDDKIISLFIDRSESIWIGTYYGGLNKIKSFRDVSLTGEISFEKYMAVIGKKDCLCNNTVMAINQDNKGYLWVGTFGGGLDRLDLNKNEFKHFTHDPLNPNSVNDNDILSLMIDMSGIVWIGTHLGEGISLMQTRSEKFKLIQKMEGVHNSLNDDVVWSIMQDSEKLLWIGTYRGGLNSYNEKNGEFKSFMFDPEDPFSISDNHVRVINEDKFGNLWIGTYSGGLNFYDKKKNKFYNFKNDPSDSTSISANQVQTLFIEPDGTFWVGTFGGGLNRFQLGDYYRDKKIKFHRYVHHQNNLTSITDNRVYTLHKDKSGTLWAGTFGGGLNRLDKNSGKFSPYLLKSSEQKLNFNEKKIMSLLDDNKGFLWIGTYGAGLSRLNPETGEYWPNIEFSGLKSDVIYGILQDKNNTLWVSSDDGIVNFDPATYTVRRYDLYDGLQSMEFSGGAYFKNKDGQMYFGGINGLNYFYPESIKVNTFIPNVVITSFKIFNNAIKGEKDSIILNYDQNFFSFEFSALDFTNPQDNEYEYILEGVDEDWRYTSSDKRYANYTNLAPGKYVFMVRGSNNDGVWNRKGTILNLKILPPFWQTWWFVLLSIILVGGTVVSLITLRVKHLLTIERLKSRLAADLHDNVGAGLTEISILSELAAKNIQPPNQLIYNQIHQISNTARILVDKMSDIVWVVNPRRDTLFDLIIRLKDSYNDFLSQMGISFSTKNLENLGEVKLPMEYRQNLYLLFKEGINNCIKHSQCKRIFLEASVRGDILEMNLIDDGVGIEQSKIEYGNGIKNIKYRADSMGGELTWSSTPDKGTIIKFRGRIRKRFWNLS